VLRLIDAATHHTYIKEVKVEDATVRIRQDIMRSFRKNLEQDAMFICFYMDKTSAGLITNERPFTGEEMISLFSSVLATAEESILPAIIYSLFNLYGPIRVFDMINAYAKSFDMKAPFKSELSSGGRGPEIPDN